MSHYFALPLALSVASLTPGMVDPSRMAALIFPGCSALQGQVRLSATLLAAIALPAVARPTHQHFGVTARSRTCVGARTDQMLLSIHSEISLNPASFRLCWLRLASAYSDRSVWTLNNFKKSGQAQARQAGGKRRGESVCNLGIGRAACGLPIVHTLAVWATKLCTDGRGKSRGR
jgi:hypothetical protein